MSAFWPILHNLAYSLNKKLFQLKKHLWAPTENQKNVINQRLRNWEIRGIILSIVLLTMGYPEFLKKGILQLFSNSSSLHLLENQENLTPQFGYSIFFNLTPRFGYSSFFSKTGYVKWLIKTSHIKTKMLIIISWENCCKHRDREKEQWISLLTSFLLKWMTNETCK